jgi:hypothetical protein
LICCNLLARLSHVLGQNARAVLRTNQPHFCSNCSPVSQIGVNASLAIKRYSFKIEPETNAILGKVGDQRVKAYVQGYSRSASCRKTTTQSDRSIKFGFYSTSVGLALDEVGFSVLITEELRHVYASTLPF